MLVCFRGGLIWLVALLSACGDVTTVHVPHAVVEGRTVYVADVNSEQDGRAAAVSACRARGGSAVFVEIVSYRYQRRATKAAKFDCTNQAATSRFL